MKKALSLLMVAMLGTAAWAGQVTFDFANGETELTKDGVTLTLDEGSGDQAPSINANGYLYFRKGNKITVEAQESMTKIEFTGYTDSQDYIVGLNVSTGEFASGAWTGEATSVTFTNPGQGANKYVTKIVVSIGEVEEPGLEYVSVNPAEGTVLPKSYGDYAMMSFEFTFDQPVTVGDLSGVKLMELGEAKAATEITPDDEWRANVEGNKVTIWGADYDGFTCTFLAKDCGYQLVIPAGVFAAGNLANKEYVIDYLGQGEATPLELVSIEPEEESVLGADTNYPQFSFTLTFNMPVTVNVEGVKLVKESPEGTEVAPSDAWNATVSSDKTSVQFWGSDYDGFVDYFSVENCDYYFIVPAGAIKAGEATNEAFAFHYYGTEAPTAISDVNTNATEVGRYNVNGQRVNANQGGIQIVKMSDGTTLKVVVK